MKQDKIPLIICAGPTASGKTALSVELALRLNGEIVSADSMQIYKYMDIGTAKPSLEERRGVPHHLMDFVEPTEDYSLADYAAAAHEAIKDIYSRSKLPIMVGGTGLYIDTVADNIKLESPGENEELRQKLSKLAAEKGNGFVHSMLKEIDPESYEKLHENDLKRVIRAIEIFELTGKTIGEYNRLSRNAETIYDCKRFMIEWDRDVLYARINRRVDEMLEAGLVDETEKLLKMGLKPENTAMQAIGYKEIAEFLSGLCSLEEAVENVKRESRRYAKRQISWFKRRDYYRLDPENAADEAEKIILCNI